MLVNIETFAKRTALRNLKRTGRLNAEQLGLTYDHFQLAALKQKENERMAAMANGSRSRASSSASRMTPKSPDLFSSSSSQSGDSKPMREETKPEERLGRRAFGNFLADVATWARDEKMVKNGLLSHIERQPKDHVMIDRIFAAWDTSSTGSLSLQVRVSRLCSSRHLFAHLRWVTQDIVNGLDSVLFNDLMQNVAWLFGIYDSDHDGYLTKDEILQVSEALLVSRQLPASQHVVRVGETKTFALVSTFFATSPAIGISAVSPTCCRTCSSLRKRPSPPCPPTLS